MRTFVMVGGLLTCSGLVGCGGPPRTEVVTAPLTDEEKAQIRKNDEATEAAERANSVDPRTARAAKSRNRDASVDDAERSR